MASDEQPKANRYSQLQFLLTLVLVVAILYIGKTVIVPLALAVLLAFILTPLVIAAQKRGLPRVPAVLLVVMITLVIFAAVGWGVGVQISSLADDLPKHSEEIKAKIEHLKSSGQGRFSKLFAAVQGIGEAAQKSPNAQPESTPIVVKQQDETPLTRLGEVASATIEPIANTGLVLVLVIFMLIKREDLRNRLISALGHGQLTGTTRVLVESAERISSLLLMQLCVNAGFGLLFGIALAVIGVKYWFLWGFLCVILRFVPYVGSWVAAAFPVVLSFAMSPGWGQPLTVIGTFVAMDLLTANVAEPLLFGHSAGVSPVALLIAAVFWTWVWGPLGLVLSTPLTVCLVVLGQHVPRLRFFALLLGDQPALEPPVAFYQRLLAGDDYEAKTIAKQYAEAKGADSLADDLLLPAIRLSRRDRRHSGLTTEDEKFIFDATQSIVRAKEVEPTIDNRPALVLGCPAQHRGEELALEMLRKTLLPTAKMTIASAKELPTEIESIIEQEKQAVVIIAVLPPGGLDQTRYLCRRLHRKFPEVRIVVGYFGKPRDYDRLLVRLRLSGASYVTTSILQSRNQIAALVEKSNAPASTSVTIEPAAIN